MTDLHIHRPHTLGLTEARRIAHLWAHKAHAKFGMECTYVENPALPVEGGIRPAGDTLHFRGSGINGTLQVAADRFELQAQLGFLVCAFKNRIESEIQGQFDKLLQTA